MQAPGVTNYVQLQFQLPKQWYHHGLVNTFEISYFELEISAN